MRLRLRKRYDVVAELEALKREYPARIDRQYIDDMILYAEVGRGRKKLGPEWVDQTRATLVDNLWATTRARAEHATQPAHYTETRET